MTLAIAQASKWLGPKRAEGGARAPGVDPPARPVRARFRGRPRASPGKRRVSVTPQSQSAPFSEAASSECTFPSRRGAREVWGNPPPGCGAGCARVRRSRLGVWPHGKAHSAPATSRKAALWGCRPHGEVHSVRRTSRKTAFCDRASRKGAVCVTARTQSALFGETRIQSALFREVAQRLPR